MGGLTHVEAFRPGAGKKVWIVWAKKGAWWCGRLQGMCPAWQPTSKSRADLSLHVRGLLLFTVFAVLLFLLITLHHATFSHVFPILIGSDFSRQAQV